MSLTSANSLVAMASLALSSAENRLITALVRFSMPKARSRPAAVTSFTPLTAANPALPIKFRTWVVGFAIMAKYLHALNRFSQVTGSWAAASMMMSFLILFRSSWVSALRNSETRASLIVTFAGFPRSADCSSIRSTALITE